MAAPNLWNEAVGRAADVAPAPRWAFSPGAALIALALTLAALGGTVAVGAWLDRQSPAPEATTYDNGMLVAQVGCDGLFGVDPVSLEQRELVALGQGCEFGGAFSPAWSRDGSHLAYGLDGGSENAAAAGLWIYESATGDRRQLTNCQGEFACDFSRIDISPDASLVAYIGRADSADGIENLLVVRAVDSGEEHRVPLIGSASQPVFSPDGDRIAVSQLGGRSGVYLVDVSGAQDGVIGSPTLLHGIVEASDLAWSPDGRWIAMTQTGGLGGLSNADRAPFNQQIRMSDKGVVIVRADGADTRVLATMPTNEAPFGPGPTWSADSASIAYAVGPVGDADDRPGRRGFEVRTVTIDGDEPTRIYDTDCCVDYYSGVVWSPDGKWIAFGVDNPSKRSESGTFLLRPDGSDERRVSTEALDVVWQPIPKGD